MAGTGTSPAAKPREAPKSGRVPRWVVAIAALGVIMGAIGAILYYGYTTGPGGVGVSDKKFWDYLDLLIVPALWLRILVLLSCHITDSFPIHWRLLLLGREVCVRGR
jgi:hypothetical protein